MLGLFVFCFSFSFTDIYRYSYVRKFTLHPGEQGCKNVINCMMTVLVLLVMNS